MSARTPQSQITRAEPEPSAPKKLRKKEETRKGDDPPRGRDFALASKHTRAPNVYRQSDPFIWPIPSAYIYRGSGGVDTRGSQLASLPTTASNGLPRMDPGARTPSREGKRAHTLSRSPIPWPSFIPRVRLARRASRSQTRRHAALARCHDESASHAGGSGRRMGMCCC